MRNKLVGVTLEDSRLPSLRDKQLLQAEQAAEGLVKKAVRKVAKVLKEKKTKKN